jgi:hypothetical protein
MAYPPNVSNDDVLRWWKLYVQDEPYTDEQLAEFRKVVRAGPEIGDVYHKVQHTRVMLELIDAIRRFDKASGEMVKRGNRINTWVLVFAVVAVLFAGISLWLSYLALIKS